MRVNSNKRFYIISVAALAVLSAYPLINGIRMAYISIINGAIEPEQYAKYVVPYAAICAALLWFAILQPVFMKLKRFAFPVGITTSFGVFFAVESFFESMQIHVAGMTLIDASALTPDTASIGGLTADAWQAALCIASPPLREQSLTYAILDRYYYVAGDSTYKIHYYLISLLLITMVCGLICGAAKMLRDDGRAAWRQNTGQDVPVTADKLLKPIFLRGASAAALIALCVFANTTAFFRKTAPIQTPLASALTGLFFVTLGASAGVYAGSYLLKKGKRLGVGVPVLISVCAAALMYAGEAAMMRGNLYRFGIGWFFRGLPAISLAPIDILIVLLSGASTWLILSAARKNEKRTCKRAAIAIVALCAAVGAAGPVIVMAAPKTADDDIIGCYVFDSNIYTYHLSSYMAFGGTPYVYAFSENEFILGNTASGGIQSYKADYYNKPVGADEFTSMQNDPLSSFISLPGLTRFKERYLLAVISDDNGGVKFGLYRMDNEIWLTEYNALGIWSIYGIKKTETTTFSDLERARMELENSPPPREMPNGFFENQMTIKDAYALARRGETLTFSDFEPFYSHLSGWDFATRQYEVIGANNVFVTLSDDGSLASAELMSGRTLDRADVVDLRDGFAAVAEYLNPLRGTMGLKIEDPHDGEYGMDMFFEDDYFRSECRYYLDTKRADRVFALFDYGERIPIKQALAEHSTSVDSLIGAGLYNVSMIPVDNPLGGEFVIPHHLYTFTLNGEAFYPSKSFMYVVFEEGFAVYYDYNELLQILDWYGYESETGALSQAIAKADVVTIAGGGYARDVILAGAGVESFVEWELSSHTPVSFTMAVNSERQR